MLLRFLLRPTPQQLTLAMSISRRYFVKGTFLTAVLPLVLAQSDLSFGSLNSLCNKTFDDANAVSLAPLNLDFIHTDGNRPEYFLSTLLWAKLYKMDNRKMIQAWP